MGSPSEVLMGTQHLKRLNERLFEPLCARSGLTKLEIDILLFLYNNPGRDTAREIVELRGLTKSHVSKSIDGLTTRGYLAGSQDPQDRRCIHLRILDAALPVTREARAVQEQFIGLLYQGFTLEERSLMASFFNRVTENARIEANRIK